MNPWQGLGQSPKKKERANNMYLEAILTELRKNSMRTAYRESWEKDGDISYLELMNGNGTLTFEDIIAGDWLLSLEDYTPTIYKDESYILCRDAFWRLPPLKRDKLMRLKNYQLPDGGLYYKYDDYTNVEIWVDFME